MMDLYFDLCMNIAGFRFKPQDLHVDFDLTILKGIGFGFELFFKPLDLD